ncbi:MAG TPA: Do family serine endopeptidase [Gemmatimonadales bacterium]|nr:Do family serine endopeptidase [Gemmatimonadales bacterium]
MPTRNLNWLKFGGLVGLAFALGLLFAGLLDLPRGSAAQEAVHQVLATVPPPSIPEAKPLQNLSEAFASVAAAVRPSVVYIRSQHTEKTAQRRLPPGMERFFPRFQQQPQFEEGSGSGFIVSTDGYILTNNHVVEGADEVRVRLLDRREFTAKVVGTDPNTDIAVLKIPATGLTPVALGNSDDARVGEWVLAIGNPLGDNLNFTVTSGIVSAKNRRLDELQRSALSIGDFIQTDAAINPGNSGGPLVNVRGEVIGINSAIASETGYYSGYGFAVPINLARNVMNQLITTGKVERAGLGINIRDASVNDADYVGLPEPTGVLVVNVNDGSPADKAGIKGGDVIVALDGKPVEHVGELQQEIGFRKPGETVKVEVARKGGAHKTFTVKLEPLPEAAGQEAVDSGQQGGGNDSQSGIIGDQLGIDVQTLTPDLREQLSLKPDVHGVIVTSVTPGGPSWNMLRPPINGQVVDIITGIENIPVSSEADLRKALAKFKTGAVVTVHCLEPGPDGLQPVVWRIRLGGT